MAMADVTVMGAGIFGLSVAWACQKRGARVRVIDPRGVGQGASGGIVGALAPHVPENWNPKKQFQFESLMMAQAFWDEVAAATGMSSGYVRAGRVQPLADDAAVGLARARAVTAADLWQGQAVWEVIPATGDAWEPASPSGWVVRDTLSAHVHPRRAVTALAAALGDVVRPEGPAEGAVVWATGWRGLQEMTAAHTRQVGAGVKGQAALLGYDAAGAAQLFAGGLHMIPHLDGTVAVGGTTEREFAQGDQVDAALEDVIARARVALPVLRDAPVIARWAGVRPRARSRAPMLGHHPFRAGEFVANGGFKIGFGMAPKVGEVMADLVLDGIDRLPEGFAAADNL